MKETQTPSKEAAPRAAAAPVDAAAGEAVVITVEKKKKKRRTSRGLRGPQRVSRRLVRASHKLVRAVSAGLSTYREREDRSSRSKRDGAIKDGLKNWARAMGKVMRKSSGVPYDVARAFDTKSYRRGMRSLVRAASAFSLFR